MLFRSNYDNDTIEHQIKQFYVAYSNLDNPTNDEQKILSAIIAIDNKIQADLGQQTLHQRSDAVRNSYLAALNQEQKTLATDLISNAVRQPRLSK